MRDDLRRWVDEGVEVAIVGNGNRIFAQDFREEFEFAGRLLIDPELHAYRAAGLRRGRREVASPSLIGDAFRALRSGARQTAVQGDPWQLGGAFVFAPGGDLKFVHRSATAGDHPSAEAIEEALADDAEVLEEAGPTASPLAPVARLLRPVLDASPLLSFDRIGFRRHALGFDPQDLEVDLFGRRCLVTGANSGIGFETALALADLGASVSLLCRDGGRGADAVESIVRATGNRRVELEVVDMADRASVEGAARRLGAEPVDVLVHNAGAMFEERIETEDGIELGFATHVAGPHRLMHGLKSALEASDDARVIWVSSGGMLTRRLEVADPQWRNREYDGVLAYAETKRAQVVLAELWAEHFSGTGVHVNSMHPGWADTQAVRRSLPRFHEITKPILRTPAEGADTVVWLAASHGADGRSGEFFFDREPARTHWLPGTRETPEAREALWQMCEALC